METQNQMRLDILFPDFLFQVLWRFSYVGGVGDILPYPQSWSYCNQFSHSGYKFCLLVELVFLLAYPSRCILF